MNQTYQKESNNSQIEPAEYYEEKQARASILDQEFPPDPKTFECETFQK